MVYFINKVKHLQQELEQANQDAQMKIRKMEQLIREKDDEVARQASSNRDQAKLAEQSLANFKRQVELNSSRMYDDMKKQMEKVESDLNRSKQLREKQTRELHKQLEEQQLKYEQKLAEQKLCSERELAQALHDTHAQKDQELDAARESLRSDLANIEQRYLEKQNQDAKTIIHLEEEVRSLRDELLHSNQLRKQQLLELGQLREDEKQRMLHEHDEQMSQMRSYLDEQKLEMEKAHAAEVEDVLEKTNDRLREIEKDYQVRHSKATESTNEQQQTIEQLKDELQRHMDQANVKLSQTTKKFEEEKRNLKQQLTNSTMTLQDTLEKEHGRLRQSERALSQQQQWYEEQLVSIRGQYEVKIQGLIPASIRQELEDTISSLKSQVGSLQQHAVILQEELDLVRHSAYASSHLVGGSSTTSTLIGSSLSLKTS
ncbi:hypothetical protein LSAT2_017127 [Lamellibrachia satsuma]|nr:hypothetical protein LSAT2_017127 [Lamellibrachia satsuma]